jgi:bifunctional enzyme CysN/CysC
MLGVRQVAVLVNKMDLVGYDRDVFDRIEREYRAFLDHVQIMPACFIPVSGRDGDNVARRASVMSWYDGPTVLESLDRFQAELPAVRAPFRMPVQAVYKFTNRGDERRIVAGSIETGTARVGEHVVFYPSGKRAVIKTFEAFNQTPSTVASAGEAVGFTLHEQIYVARGEVATIDTEPRPKVTTRLRVNLFWLGESPLVRKKDYVLRLGSARVTMRVEEVLRVIDASDLTAADQKQRVDRHEVADCTLKLNRAIAVDLVDEIAATSRFVIVDDYEICGGGIVREALPDSQASVRDKVRLRNYKWEPSFIAPDRRAARFAQRPTLLLITGAKNVDRKSLAKGLESRLFDEGKTVYFLGIGNVLYGIDSDISRSLENRQEHIRRLAEVANLMLDAGMILIATAADLTQEDLEFNNTTVDPDRIETVWLGDVTTDVNYDLLLSEHETDDEAVERIKLLLQDKGIIFRPW